MTRVAGCEGEPPRVAYAVGRSVGNAVARNRLRRRLRALTREHVDAFAPGHLYMIAATPSAASVTYRELDRAFSGCLAAVSESS
jgi:ribonuclease P protein component